jgi:hypothetical protein
LIKLSLKSIQGEYRTYGRAGAEPSVILNVLDSPADVCITITT